MLEVITIVIAVLAFLAAAWQAYIANDSEKRQLRAYVGVHPVGFMGLENNDPVGVGFNFINHGQTPAQRFNFVGVVDLLPYPLPQGYDLNNAPTRPLQDGVIFANETPPMTGWTWDRGKIDPSTKKELISPNPTHEIYAHGAATYDDIFGSHWHTEFCFYLNPASLLRDANGNILPDKDGHLQFSMGSMPWVQQGFLRGFSQRVRFEIKRNQRNQALEHTVYVTRINNKIQLCGGSDTDKNSSMWGASNCRFAWT